MEQTFTEYTKEARRDFVKAINRQAWSTELRMEAENLLIAYDQLQTQLTEANGKIEELTKSLIETQKREHKKELFIDELMSKHARRSSALAEIRSAITKYDNS